MIDAKELHIGAHVLVKGVRAKVVGIKEITAEKGKPLYQINVAGSPYGRQIFITVMSNSDEIEPIPITPKLLEELGFEKFFDQDKVYWCKNFSNGMYLIVKIDIDVCRARIKSYYVTYDIFHFKYLHELENIVFLTTKQELIKD